MAIMSFPPKNRFEQGVGNGELNKHKPDQFRKLGTQVLGDPVDRLRADMQSQQKMQGSNVHDFKIPKPPGLFEDIE